MYAPFSTSADYSVCSVFLRDGDALNTPVEYHDSAEKYGVQ
jgi:hypothetical protein